MVKKRMAHGALSLLILSGILAVSPMRSVAQDSVAADLAALTLRPSDMPETGWVYRGAFMQSIEAEAADVAAYRGRGLAAEDVEARLRAAGWQRKYVNTLAKPSDADPSIPSRIVRSYVTAYASATEAAQGFAFLEDETDIVAAQDVPLNRELGDESEATRERGTSQGRPFRSLDLTFRIGHLVAGATIVAYPAAEYADPDLAEVEALASVLATRLSALPDSGVTIGGSVLRLTGYGSSVVTYDDAYFRFESVDVPLEGEDQPATEARIATYAGATDVYQLWQGVDIGTDAGVLYGVTLLRFPDASSASAWIRDLAPTLGSHQYYGDLSAWDAPTVGDESVALSYAAGGGTADDPLARLIAARIGVDVVRVHLVPQGGLQQVSSDALQALAQMQVDCLRVSSCPDGTAITATLIAAIDTREGTPIAVP